MAEPLQSRLAAQAALNEQGAAWSPRHYCPADPASAAALADLLDSGAVVATFDTLAEQLGGLLETREPTQSLPAEELKGRVAAHLGGVPRHRYGRWVFYPWSGRLVHVLPEAEFRELRTSRNRNKITREEQERLRGLTLAVAGLSVGSSTAVTLALEEIGGAFKLADFDRLELSNMNRLRAGVHHLGINKAVLTAREIFELNPYARVEVFTDGVTQENIAAFLADVDILFEECDDLQIKIRLREEARARRIPVVMETSDRGLIDVERFDQEPDRPILHGLVGDVRADDVAGLSTYEKVPIVLRIIGASSMSHRMAASLVDIETTLKTWPQLASAVALGGALNADVARRLALGQFGGSGRYYVDVEQLVSDEVDGSVAEAPSYEVEISPEAQRAPVITRPHESAGLSRDTVRALVEYATMAPSGGNCQPWKFLFRDHTLYCLHDRARSESLLDHEDMASHLALGAAAENIALAAPAFGLEARIESFPNVELEHCTAAITFRGSPHGSDGMVDLIARRVTNRKLGERVPLGSDERETLFAAAEHAGARLQLLTDEPSLAAIGDVLARGDRARFLSPVMHRELMSELRWSREEVERTRDGVDVATLEMTPTDVAGMRLISSWSMMTVLRGIGAGRGLEKPTRKVIDAASAVGLLTLPGTGRESFFTGGRAMQRVWLTATAHELAFQPMAALIYLFRRLERGADGLSATEREQLAPLRRRYLELLPVGEEESEVMLFRVARAGPPTARALRRPVDQVLTFAEGASDESRAA